MPETVADAYLDRILALANTQSPDLTAWIRSHRTGLSGLINETIARESAALIAAEAPGKGIEPSHIAKSSSKGPWAKLIEQAQFALTQMYPPLVKGSPEWEERVELLTKMFGSGLKPGDDGAVVELDGELFGEWRIAANKDRSEEGLAIRASGHWMPRLSRIKGSRWLRQGGRSYILIPIEKTPQAVSLLEDGNLPLALSIQLGLLIDTELQECLELELISAAKTVSDIPDPELREQVASLVEQVPMAKPFQPRPFQAVGIAFASLAGYRAIIGDAPGLGKTLQAIGAMSLDHNKLIPALVVAPSTVVINWANEIKKFAPWFQPVIIRSSNTPIPSPTDRTIYIVSWGLLDRVLEGLLMVGLKLAVFDESHNAKNPAALRSRAAKALAHSLPHTLLLSGTALDDKPEDLWHQLHMIDPDEFPTKEDFKRRYKGTAKRVVRQRRGGEVFERAYDIEGSRGLDELAKRLRCYMVRRLKTEVATELPAKTRTALWVELSPSAQRAYDKVEDELPKWIRNEYRKRLIKRAAKVYARHYRQGLPPLAAAQLAVDEVNADMRPANELAQLAMIRLGYLRRMLGEAKIPAAVEWIRDFFASGRDRPLVVFVEHQKPLEALGKALDKLGLRWTYIDGSVNVDERARRAEAFQNGEYDVIIGSKAMDTGINLFRASDVLFVERWWKPTQEEQAEDRTHRIGQVHPVQIHYLMAPNTVDEHVAELVDRKRDTFEAVMGGEAVRTAEDRADLQDTDVSQSISSAMVARVAGALADGADLRPITIKDLRRYLERAS